MTELTHVELYNQIAQGIITDLKPYIDKGEEYRSVIATTGQYVDELVAYGEVNIITTLIQQGYAREYYELWKNHENARVRRTLAAKGLYPKDYIYDTDDLVRSHVLGTHPEYITPGCDKSPAEWMTMKNVLEALPTIALGQLDMLLDASKQPGREGDLASQDAYDLKRGSLIVKPTTIERTMQVDYKPYVRHINASELQTLLEQGAYEFVLTKGGERKYVIQPTLQLIAKWIFGIPAKRLDEFNYELY